MPAAPATRPSAVARPAKGRLTAIARPAAAPRERSRDGRRIDFVAYLAAKLNARPEEIAAARAAAEAMRVKQARLKQVRLAEARSRRVAPALTGLLPFPPFDAEPAVGESSADGPSPAARRPADAAPHGRYTRTAA